jgi:hypothetical protein
MPRKRALPEDAEIAISGRIEPVLVNGGATIKSMSAAFMADVERAWRKHGAKVLDVLAEKYPQAFFGGMGCALKYRSASSAAVVSQKKCAPQTARSPFLTRPIVFRVSRRLASAARESRLPAAVFSGAGSQRPPEPRPCVFAGGANDGVCEELRGATRGPHQCPTMRPLWTCRSRSPRARNAAGL